MSRRKQRLYLMVIGLSAIGLAVDRLVLPASGSDVVVAIPQRSSVAGAAAGAGGAGVAGSPRMSAGVAGALPPAVLAAARFPAILSGASARAGVPEAGGPGSGGALRDLFGPTDLARSQLQSGLMGRAGSGNVERGRSAEQELLAERFSEAHTLSAVVSDGAFMIAIVDGAWIRIGESVDGCVLVRFADQKACFDCGVAIVELSVGGSP